MCISVIYFEHKYLKQRTTSKLVNDCLVLQEVSEELVETVQN